MYEQIFATITSSTSDIFTILAFALGIIGVAGGAVGYFAKGRAEAVIALSAKENALLKDDNTRLEKANVEANARIAQLEAENKRVWDKAQGSAQLVALTSEIKSLVLYLKTDKEVQNGKQP